MDGRLTVFVWEPAELFWDEHPVIAEGVVCVSGSRCWPGVWRMALPETQAVAKNVPNQSPCE